MKVGKVAFHQSQRESVEEEGLTCDPKADPEWVSHRDPILALPNHAQVCRHATDFLRRWLPVCEDVPKETSQNLW